MTIHYFNTPVSNVDCTKRTNPAKLRVLAAALVAATLGLHGGLSQATESAGPPAMAAPPAGAYKLDKSPASLVLRASSRRASPPTRRALAVSTWT